MTTNIIISKQHQCVLLPYDGHIKTMWPEANTIGHNGSTFAVIPHRPKEAIMLRTLGIAVPPPVLQYYDWEGGNPFDVQKKTVALLTSNRRAYALNDMGTGKTRSALWAWRYLNRMGVANKLLVIAPLSTLKFTWLHEILETVPGCKAVVLHGSAQQRRDLLAKSNADIFIINHDGLRVIAKELYERHDIDCLVLDELAVYRNTSQRYKQMQVFAQRFTWAWGMSGRPMPNSPVDVWTQCKILTPHTVPKFLRHARSMLLEQVSQFKWVPRTGAIEKAMSWMQPAVRFALDDVIELPQAVYRTIDVDLSEQQAKAYRKLSNDFAIMIEQKLITAANAGVAMGKLLQVGAGYVYSTNPSFVTLDSAPRQEALLEILDEAPHKVIVFAPWRHLIDGLSALFKHNEIDHAIVHGDINKRDEIFSDFQMTDRYRVLLAHPGCVHHGLTLTAATTCVWYSPVPSLEIYEQACARIRRIGQANKQQFLHFQATSVEKRIYALLRGKARLQDEFLTLMKNAMGDQQ